MAPRIPRVALALVGAFVALGPVSSALAASPAEPALPTGGACTSSTGITVVVDMTAFGNGVQVRCAPQPVRSGFDALTRAGFTFQGTTQFPGLLCRIGGEPASDPCHGAPPANAYWAYWHAPRGGSWTYSTSGAGSRVPPPGSVEGWAFGNEAEPAVDPPDPAPTTSTRPPTTTTPPSSGGTGGGTGGTSPTDGSTDDATATSTPAGAETTTSTTGGASDASTTTTRAAGAGASEDDESDSESAAGAPGQSDDGGSGGGSPAGAIVGLLAVAGLVLAGVRVARQRASEEEPA